MKKLRMAIPKGRLYKEVIEILDDIGIKIINGERSYKPYVSDPEIEVKIFKPQDIPRIVEISSCDIGFTGYDFVVETNSNVKELMDLELNPVKVIAAVPNNLVSRNIKKRKIRVVSQYERITKRFLKAEGYKYVLLKSYGATEVFPPEDAEMIVDNTETGRTLRENNLTVIKSIMESSTRFIANKKALEDDWKTKKINEMTMLFCAVLEGRKRVLLEMNVPKEKLKKIVKILPCMKSPTVQKLYNDDYAVKVAVKKSEVSRIIPLVKRMGAEDIIEYELKKAIA